VSLRLIRPGRGVAGVISNQGNDGVDLRIHPLDVSQVGIHRFAGGKLSFTYQPRHLNGTHAADIRSVVRSPGDRPTGGTITRISNAGH
jgi:hypothetical protein